MRRYLSKPVALVAGFALAAGVCSAATAATSGHQSAGAAPASASPASASPAGRTTTRSVFLVNGERLGAAAPAGHGLAVTSGAAWPGGQLQVLTLNGHRYALPSDAMPYLGHGLDPSLFDLTALGRAEQAGRLPVQVTYKNSNHAKPPTIPGLTITSAGPEAGNDRAAGYLTPAGAARFGAALSRQYAADHAHASYRQKGLFAHDVSIALAGPAESPAARPDAKTYTLTVHGTNLAGQPDTGDYVVVTNVDDSTLSTAQNSVAKFDDGMAKLSLPAGNYWAVGEFGLGTGISPYPVSRVVALPQFSITANTTVQVAEKAATSRIGFTTQRPAITRAIDFGLYRTPASGLVTGLQWFNVGRGRDKPAAPMYVSPTQAKPATGALTSVSEGWLYSQPGTPGTPYEYDLAYSSAGTVPAQHHVVNQASLATVNDRFYSATAAVGLEGGQPYFPVQLKTGVGGRQESSFVSLERAIEFPAAVTVYTSAGPGLSWQQDFFPSALWPGFAGQESSPQSYRPGETVTQDWGAYPLHPAPDVKLINASDNYSLFEAADRGGNTLNLWLNGFSDSVPGLAGGAEINTKPFKTAISYTIDQNGKQVAGGPVAKPQGYLEASATLSPKPSVIKVELSTSLHSWLQRLSTATQTVWTWRSVHETGATPPPGWYCGGESRTRQCAAQPMMTLAYDVVGEALNGSTSAGPQQIKVSVGHIQLASQPKVTGLHMQVSFNGGKTWSPATITGTDGSYQAAFTAPAGAKVTMRTSATDAAGGSVTETIHNAYQIAS